MLCGCAFCLGRCRGSEALQEADRQGRAKAKAQLFVQPDGAHIVGIGVEKGRLSRPDDAADQDLHQPARIALPAMIWVRADRAHFRIARHPEPLVSDQGTFQSRSHLWARSCSMSTADSAWPSLAAAIALLAARDGDRLEARARCGFSHRRAARRIGLI